MRTSVTTTFLILMLSLSAAAQTSTAPDALLRTGLDAYRAGDYAAAVPDLQAASQAYLSPQRMQTYVNTGKYEGLTSLETALVYLAMAQSHMGRDDDAREAIVRLLAAERIEPVYASIPFESDVAEFETLVTRLMPTAGLPRNTQLASGNAPAPVRRETVVATAPEPATALPPVAEQTTTVPSAPATVVAEETPQPSSAPAPVDVVPCADHAAASQSARKIVQPTIAAEREAAQRASQGQPADAESESRRAFLVSLRQADAHASNENINEASEAYSRIATTENVPRDVLAAAAVGLYRVGNFRGSVSAFTRMATFARGEEDLRYYNAVALYETGSYAEAKKELECALPFIQMTDDVARYRAKIEETSAQQAMR